MPYIPTLEQIADRMREKYPWAGERDILAMAESEHAHNETQKDLRPLTLHEVAQRWYSYEKVITAMHSGRLRPNNEGTFDWLHVLSVDIGIASLHNRPHPDVERWRGESNWEKAAAAFYELRVRHRIEDLVRATCAPALETTPPDGLTNVYFIEALGLNVCKIGKANSIAKRMKDLQPASGARLILLAYLHAPAAEERRLHVKFKDERSHGEWFNISPRLRRFINKTRKTLPIATIEEAA